MKRSSMLVAACLTLSSCTTGRFWNYNASEHPAEFRSNLKECIARFDHDQLASVEAGLDYDISGSLLFHTSSDDVADCMWKNGHYVTQGPMVP